MSGATASAGAPTAPGGVAPAASTPASAAACRVLAAALAVLALACLGVAVALLPPVLARIAADGRAGGSGPGPYVPSLAALLAALALAGVAVRLWTRASGIASRRVRRAAGALAAAVLAALLTGEVLARTALRPEDVLDGDAPWIRRWNAASGTRLGSAAGEHRVNRWDPELGWAPSEGYAADGLHVNSRGARGSREDPLEKPAGERRIVAIGDSFTFGDGVRDEEAWPALVERELAGARVVNLGVLGYGTDQVLLRFERTGVGHAPDVVVLGFFGPDAERNVLAFRDYAKPVFRLAGDGLALEGVPIPRPDDPSAAWTESEPRSWLCAAVVKRWRAMLDRTRFAPKWEVTRRILDRLLGAARARDAELRLAYFPDKRASFDADPEDCEVVLAEWARARGVPFLGLRDAFLALSPEDRARVYHGHWTPFGNEVVAEAIARWLAAPGG